MRFLDIFFFVFTTQQQHAQMEQSKIFISFVNERKLSFERISLVPKYGTYPALDLLFHDLASLGHGSAVTIFGKNYKSPRATLSRDLSAFLRQRSVLN